MNANLMLRMLHKAGQLAVQNDRVHAAKRDMYS